MDKSHFPSRASMDQKGKCSSPRENQLHEASNLSPPYPRLSCSLQQLGLGTGNALSLLQLCVEPAGWIRPGATRGTQRIRALATGAELDHTSSITSAPVTQCSVLSLLLPHADTPGCQGSVSHQGQPTGPWLIPSRCHCTEPHRGIRAGAHNSSSP